MSVGSFLWGRLAATELSALLATYAATITIMGYEQELFAQTGQVRTEHAR